MWRRLVIIALLTSPLFFAAGAQTPVEVPTPVDNPDVLNDRLLRLAADLVESTRKLEDSVERGAVEKIVEPAPTPTHAAALRRKAAPAASTPRPTTTPSPTKAPKTLMELLRPKRKGPF